MSLYIPMYNSFTSLCDNKSLMKHLARIYIIVLFTLLLYGMAEPVVIDNLLEQQILVSDVAVGPKLKINYLARNNSKPIYQVSGIIWGPSNQAFINLPVRLKNEKCPNSINVIFKVDTGSGITTLTKQVIQRLYQCSDALMDDYPYVLLINGKKGFAVNSTKHYENLNILGTDFLRRHKVELKVQYSEDSNQNLTLTFRTLSPDIENEIENGEL